MSIPGRNSVSRVTPVSHAELVSASNSETYANVRGIMISGSGGTLNLTWESGQETDGVFLQPGIPYPFVVTQIRTGGSYTGAVLLHY